MRTWLAVALVVAFTVAGCSRDVDPPVYDNPFDPAGAQPGTGWNLSATVAGDSVVLTWRNILPNTTVLNPDGTLSTYKLLHSTDEPVPTDPATDVRYATPSANQPIRATHFGFDPQRANYYRVVGEGVVIEGSTVVAVDQSGTPVSVIPVGGAATANSRSIDLLVRGTVSDAVQFAFTEAFEDVQTFAIEPGVRTRVTVQLPTFPSDGAQQEIFYRGTTGGVPGATGSISIRASFNPSVRPLSGIRLSRERSRNVAVDSTVVVEVVGDGITGLEVYNFAPNNPAQRDTNLVAAPDPVGPVTLPLDVPRGGAEGAGAWNWLFVVDSELGYSKNVTFTLEPAGAIRGAEIEVLEGPVVRGGRVTLVATADQAGSMLISEEVPPLSATWQAFADTFAFDLSSGDGEKTIYAYFANDFSDELSVAVTRTTRVDTLPPLPRLPGERGDR